MLQNNKSHASCKLETISGSAGNEHRLSLEGFWRVRNLRKLYADLQALTTLPHSTIILDGHNLKEFDTSAALLICKFFTDQGKKLEQITPINFTSGQVNIFTLVKENFRKDTQRNATPALDLTQTIGKNTLDLTRLTMQILAFIGHTSHEIWNTFLHPRFLRLKELFVQLEVVCLQAIPVTVLVTFLIGIVIAYLFAIQIEKYGANIFIVDAVGLAMCRELSPIIVAIIVAGRSGSAFTAQIGTMKLNEEIDAMLTLGLSPLRVLVIPRILALIIAMPILVALGDAIGIFGSMFVADLRLGITNVTFVQRLQSVLPVRSVMVGLIKAPVFAAFIATIGCRMGLMVENNARSVGLNTTSTVVQSIVSVILLNAAFAVIFTELGI